jgi:hypothetical protein
LKKFFSSSKPFHSSRNSSETHLNWVNIVSDDDELGLLLFHQLGDCVASGSQGCGLLRWSVILSGDLGFGLCLQAGALLQLCLWAILLQDLEELDGGLLVQSLRELVDWWWDLETLLQDCLVALDADVLGPADEAGEITLWLDVLS